MQHKRTNAGRIRTIHFTTIGSAKMPVKRGSARMPVERDPAERAALS